MNHLIGFDDRYIVLKNHSISYWKCFMRGIPKNKRRVYFLWNFRNICDLENLPLASLPCWDNLYQYIKVIILKRLRGLDGDGI